MMLRWEVGHEGQATILCITCPTWWKCTHYPGHSSVKQVKLIELCVQDNEGSLSSCVQDLNYIITGIFHIQYKPITYARGEIKFNKKVLGKGTLTWYHLFPTHFLLNYLYFTNGDVFNKCVLGVARARPGTQNQHLKIHSVEKLLTHPTNAISRSG